EEYIADRCRTDDGPRSAWLLGRAMTDDAQPAVGANWALDKLVKGAWEPVAGGGVTGSSGLFHFCKNLVIGETVRLRVWQDREAPAILLRHLSEKLTIAQVPLRVLADGPRAAGPAALRPLRGTVTDSASG